MESYALLLVTGPSDEGFRGLLIDPDRPRTDWPEIEVEFACPEKRNSQSWQDWRAIELAEPERREAFVSVRAATEPSSIVKFEFARGHWNPKTERPFLAAFEAKPLCGAERSAELMALTSETPERDEDWIGRWRWETPFGREIEALVHPDRDPESLARKILAREALVREIYEHECEMERVRYEPDEGIIYVGSDGKAIVLDHHGAFLFYASDNGNDVEDMGIRPMPKGLDRGLYYFTGRGWGSGPDMNGEYDSGFDVDTFVKADASHLARFESEAAATGYAADIEDYESEVDLPATPVV